MHMQRKGNGDATETSGFRCSRRTPHGARTAPPAPNSRRPEQSIAAAPTSSIEDYWSKRVLARTIALARNGMLDLTLPDTVHDVVGKLNRQRRSSHRILRPFSITL